jgi:hypothetical protein
MRHAVAIGGGAYADKNPNPVNRQITVSNCDLKASCNVQALDAHGNTESYIFQNNRVHGGIDFGGMWGRIVGNDILGRNSSQAGIALYATEWKSPDFEIVNNRIRTTTTESFKNRGAIYLHINNNTIVPGATIILNNRISVSGKIGDCRSLRLVNNNPTINWFLRIENNDFFATDWGSHLTVDCKSGSRFNNLVISNNYFRNGNVSIPEHSVSNLTFVGNLPLGDRH